jgi:hypothetical protein
MANRLFTQEPVSKPGSNVFDMSHDVKLSTKFGVLTPVYVQDVVPGDQIKIKANAFVRMAPQIAPIMHKVNVYLHFFFVPNRLVWPNWEKFITGGEDGQDTTVWPHFTLNLKNVNPGQLHDYLGLPVGDDVLNAGNSTFSAIPFNAYQLIYKEYYRDQNLIADNYQQLSDGANGIGTNNIVRKRSWNHDYLTSCLPFPQKGPEAMLPLGSEAPVKWDTSKYPTIGNYQFIRDGGGNAVNIGQALTAGLTSGPTQSEVAISTAVPGNGVNAGFLDLGDTHMADLSQATAASITDLRRAVKLQEWLEKNARGGSRYIESIYVHFGVKSSDARLQRPEYLGGMSAPVKISEVLATAGYSVDGDPNIEVPQANMAGHGLSVGGSAPIGMFAEEHGYIMGIMSVMPLTAYQQGIPRHFLRSDKFDYFWPEFQHIGEQPVYNEEVAVQGSNADKDTFGYIPRYAEYKYMNNRVAGDMRKSLDFWHMGRKFDSMPALNQDFIEMDNKEVERVFAVQDGTQDNLWCHIYHEVKAKRPMAVFGSPKFV